MPIILNATNELQHTVAYGQHFTFRPGQLKMMEEKFATFLAAQRHYQGFVGLSDNFMDPAYKDTPEGQKEFDKAQAQGISSRIEHLHWLVKNNTDSLRQDLRSMNIDSDPRGFMSDGELYALETLAAYQKAGDDKKQERISRALELEKKLGLKG